MEKDYYNGKYFYQLLGFLLYVSHGWPSGAAILINM